MPIADLKARVDQLIWGHDLRQIAPWHARGLRVLRTIYVVLRDVLEGDITLRAMSLVYTTILSAVPVLAVSFSVLKGFGVHKDIEPMLSNVFAHLGPSGSELLGTILGFVDNVKVSVLGFVGLGMLFYTSISLLQKIERACNDAWHTTEERSFGRRFSDYLSIILVGPVLMVSAIGITGAVSSNSIVLWLSSIEPLGTWIAFSQTLIPYALVIIAFTFVYVFMPNTKVKILSALVGGIVAGILWEAWGILCTRFVASSASYAAIYSGFATLFILMIWLYVSWLIFLIGANIAFYFQYPNQLRLEQENPILLGRIREKLALFIAHKLGSAYYQRREPWTRRELAEEANVMVDVLAPVLEALIDRDLVVQTSDDPPGYVPRAAPEKITMKEILDAIRVSESTPDTIPNSSPAESWMTEIESAIEETLQHRTLKDLSN